MANFQASIKLSLLIFLFFVSFSPITLLKASDPVRRNVENSIVTSLYSSWDMVKSLVQEAQKRFLPPNLEILEKKAESTDSSERIKMAAKKSFEEGEATLEKTAESAATVMESAMHKAKDKVEHKLSQGHGEEADEL